MIDNTGRDINTIIEKKKIKFFGKANLWPPYAKALSLFPKRRQLFLQTMKKKRCQLPSKKFLFLKEQPLKRKYRLLVVKTKKRKVQKYHSNLSIYESYTSKIEK